MLHYYYYLSKCCIHLCDVGVPQRWVYPSLTHELMLKDNMDLVRLIHFESYFASRVDADCRVQG